MVKPGEVYPLVASHNTVRYVSASFAWHVWSSRWSLKLAVTVHFGL
jgi:hypothetical protein